jgi:hypothetical protein
MNAQNLAGLLMILYLFVAVEVYDSASKKHPELDKTKLFYTSLAIFAFIFVGIFLLFAKL